MIVAQGCGAEKAMPSDDFSDLAAVDSKSDSFSRRMKILGALSYGDPAATADYESPPTFRGFQFTGQMGDGVDIRVSSSDGDPVAWLLDSSFHIVAKNDDSDGTTNSHITATLQQDGTHTIAFRDYDLAKATMKVTLAGTAKAGLSSAALVGSYSTDLHKLPFMNLYANGKYTSYSTMGGGGGPRLGTWSFVPPNTLELKDTYSPPNLATFTLAAAGKDYDVTVVNDNNVLIPLDPGVTGKLTRAAQPVGCLQKAECPSPKACKLDSSVDHKTCQ
jgi:hypothetical protein